MRVDWSQPASKRIHVVVRVRYVNILVYVRVRFIDILVFEEQVLEVFWFWGWGLGIIWCLMVRYMFHKKWNVIVDFIHFSQKIFWQKVILVSDLWTCARSRRRRRTSSTWTRSTTSAPWHARQVPSMSFDSNNPSLPIIYHIPLLFMYSCIHVFELENYSIPISLEPI